MVRQLIASMLVIPAVACGGSDPPGGGVDAIPTSVTVSHPGGTIFIGAQVQFQATAMLSNGTSAPATNAVWGSDAPAVATVSGSGLVTARGAGEATIFADAPMRGMQRVRVFPGFGGTWSGSEVSTVCEESGVFVGLICTPDFLAVGNVFAHNVRFTQTDDAVTATIDFGGGLTTDTPGTVSVGGDLELTSAPVLPATPGINIQTQNWRSRADVPSQLTGTYEWFFTAPGLPGSARQVSELRDVIRTAAPASVGSGASRSGHADALARLSAEIERRR